MAKTSYVLRALTILGLEEMLKLSEVLKVKQAPLKKAAGEELILWDDNQAPEREPKPQPQVEAKVLEFPKKSITEFSEYQETAPESSEDETNGSKVLPSDLVLWQREVSKESGEAIHKLGAMKGYQKSTQMYVVKTPAQDGKEKIRFASTNGILVNKKQA